MARTDPKLYPNAYKRWQPWEDEVLRGVLKKVGESELMRIFGRTISAIMRRAGELRKLDGQALEARDAQNPQVAKLVTDRVLKNARARHLNKQFDASTFLSSVAQAQVYEHIRAGRCYWSGLPFEMESGEFFSPSLDRLDPNKGYEDGNVVVAAMGVNIARNSFPMPQVVAMCEGIVEQARRDPERFRLVPSKRWGGKRRTDDYLQHVVEELKPARGQVIPAR